MQLELFPKEKQMNNFEVWQTDDWVIRLDKETNTVNVQTYKGMNKDSLNRLMDILSDIEVELQPVVWFVDPDGTVYIE